MAFYKVLKSATSSIKYFFKQPFYRARFMYVYYRKRISLDDKAIIFESFSGDDMTGNPFYLLMEACTNEKYKDFTKYVAVKKSDMDGDKKVLGLLEHYGILDKVKIVILSSAKYCKILASAKYIVDNVSLPTYFVKREGQVYLNTWHGTPLKGLGRSIKDNPNSIGNVQRNFLMADYLLYPNKYSFEHIKRDYMLDNFYKGKYVLSGYPCNSAFFNKARRDEIRHNLELTNKKVVVYMPTWRGVGTGNCVDKHIYYLMHFLYELESRLNEDIVVYVKLHHLAMSSITLDDFEKIKPFPNEFETYDFLSIADCLITDYSSVMFDFLNTDKKVLLYTYDKEEYMAGRSVYTDIEDLPFQSFDVPKKLCDVLNGDLSTANDYAQAKNTFCSYDSEYSAKDLLALLIDGKASEKMEIIPGEKYHNNKENVLIFAGELAKNGITTALKSLLSNVDTNKRNYILTFYTKKTQKNKLVLNDFSEEISYIPIQGAKNLDFLGALCQFLYFKLNVNTAFINKHIELNSKREIERCYPSIHFDYAIHYTGYERHIIHIFNAMDAKTAIYTHNDLLSERKTKNNIHVPSLKKAYSQFDRIVIIRDSMREEIKKNIKGVNDNKIVVAHNFNDIKNIKSKSKLEPEFNEDTYSNVSIDVLKNILNKKDAVKFIDIARYSYEKGLDQLIYAFQKFHNENCNSYLIIVGGDGRMFEEIKEIAESPNVKNVVIIKSVSNPYPILNKCDCFVLSSHYEGLPMTIMEALILDKKVISTNIPGPSEFLMQGYGYLVDDSVDGVLKGMKEYVSTGLNSLTKFDAEKFNENALEEFNRIFD